jgi:hypothetical protein
VILRCTGKVLDILDASPATSPQPSEDDWYVNLLWVERQKCLLFTHAGTLFSVFEAGVRKPDLRPVGAYVVTVIEVELRAEGLPPGTFGRLDPDQVVIAKTASRRTLGYMNDIAFHIRYQIEDAGGLSHTDIGALNHRLGRTLHNCGGTYAHPIERVLERRPPMTQI